ncbi:hypothetical protein [Kitasatospora phosalacinea]|uniref:Helix-turn-helix domain-containing protein n=1 Tax=Kitasatospora phosalacinea TaxID=2065 RepID=A0ABW6GR73_9ACTN
MTSASPGRAPAGFMWIEGAAKELGVKVCTLHKWRQRKVGPLAVRHAGRLMYAEVDIANYLQGLVDEAKSSAVVRIPRPDVRLQPAA